MLAPELVLSLAWQDYSVAKDDLKELQKLSAADGTEWTMTHSYFANIGGFVIRDNAEKELEASTTIHQNHKCHTPFHLTAASIVRLRKSGQLPKMPSISADDIADKSKTDSFAKAVSVAQITWIIVQVLARTAKRLAISQLEIAVVAYSSCAIMIYILRWSRPKGVLLPHTILIFPGLIPPEITKQETQKMLALSALLFYPIGEKYVAEKNGCPISNDCVPHSFSGNNEAAYNFVMGLALGSSLFGGIHVAVWNFSFPTRTELLIWRVASIYCTCFFFLFLGVLGIIGGKSEWFQRLLSKLVSILYILARVFMIVEMFRTLCFLPPGAYISTWATNIPHLA